MNSDNNLEIVSFLAAADQSLTNSHLIRCKFVLLQNRTFRVMILGPLSRYAYHADLLAAYCDSHQITSTWERRPDTLRVTSPDITILGGGHLAWNLQTREARFGGSSRAYGCVDLNSLPDLLGTAPLFAGHRIIVDD